MIASSMRSAFRTPALAAICALVAALCILAAGLVSAPQADAAVRISYKQVLMAKGQSQTLSVKGTSKKATWSSSKKSVATVSKAGKVKAKKAGTATITAKAGKKSYKAQVTVAKKSTKVLVAYMSKSGTTKAVAKKIKKLAGADMVRIVERDTYTSSYEALTEIAQDEQKRNARPALSTKIKNLSQYKTVVLGYPIWWGKEPMLIRTFLEKNSMKGKVVVPFCTSGGSGFSGSKAGIVKYAKGATVKTGKDLADASNKTIRAWLEKDGVLAASSTASGSDTSSSGDNPDGDQAQGATDPADQQGEQVASRSIVVYFSRTGENYSVGTITEGNTAIVAKMIAQRTGSDMFEIVPAVAYPTVYSECTAVARTEQSQNARPALASTLTNLAGYDTVYLGYPIWWTDLPMVVYTFVESQNWAGKTVVPFCTHAGSGAAGTKAKLEEKCTGATVRDVLAIRGADAQNNRDTTQATVDAWLAK